jgi:glucan 1,3-beta-glucosidase
VPWLTASSILVSLSMTPLPHILATIGGLCFLPAMLALKLGFPYGSEKVRGVNLGGWLVLEVRRA